MKVKIHQIVPERDVNHLMFRSLSSIMKLNGGRIPREIYTCVYEGELDAKTLENVFYILNCVHPSDYRARSLSVSDVIEVIHSTEKSSFYFCDSVGFHAIPFSQTND